jgi:hypothetical protein
MSGHLKNACPCREAAYREGWAAGHNQGISCGHPLHVGCCGEQEISESWECSEAAKTLSGGRCSGCGAAVTCVCPFGSLATQCKARTTATDPPQDCDWPFCGCDPHAEKVIDSLREQGWASAREHANVRQALAGLEALWQRPGENANDAFERIAADFWQETGYLRPGKDLPAAMGAGCDEERQDAWKGWVARRVDMAREAIQAADAGRPDMGDRLVHSLNRKLLAAYEENEADRRLRENAWLDFQGCLSEAVRLLGKALPLVRSLDRNNGADRFDVASAIASFVKAHQVPAPDAASDASTKGGG